MNKGLSVIEFLVALAVIVILLGVALWPFASFRDEKLLDGAAADILATLDEARTRTLSSDGGLTYGVLFESDKITLVPDNRVTFFHSRLRISEINLNGGNEVTFKRLTGVTDNYGQVIISLVADADRQRIVAISQAGGIGLE